MSDITVIGLGLMGSALARTIYIAGHCITVWNRSPEKMQSFVDDGIATAPDLVSAIKASPIVLFCIDNYAVTHALLNNAIIAPLLAGRTVVQLSTGTPREALEAAEWMNQHGVSYLDGAILAGPNDIGTTSGQILLSGDETAFSKAGKILDSLGDDVRYLGSNYRAASTLDLAWLCDSYGRMLAVTHAARLCESEDVGFDNFANLFEANSMVRHFANVIQSGDFENCTATLQVWSSALERIQAQARDTGIDTGFPDFVDNLFKKAIKAGYGEEHVMSLVKVLRRYQENA
jgi:3-hydroxyisobutyrate dehydrogenase-like beta-hydroxyacid dehydrogenase